MSQFLAPALRQAGVIVEADHVRFTNEIVLE